ncbi:MAG: spore coat protein U domain-containing protein [Acidobacteriaceae bacterium]|nr:spore coat protein U domain-containing protein [Acidobacteriaceae bacterium]
MTDSAGNKLFFDLYTDEARTDVWGTWFGKHSKGPSIDAPIGRSQRAEGSVAIYARLQGGQANVPLGVYSSTISGNQVAIRYGLASGGNCSAIRGSGARETGSITITARVGSGDPSLQPMVAPDATRGAGTGSAGSGNESQPTRNVWDRLKENAEYQRQQRERDSAESYDHSKPLCRPSDPDVHLFDGVWSGPNCTAIDARTRQPVQTKGDRRQKQAEDEQSNRAAYLESHSCMTTMGADKANELADDCKRVTSSPHSACNIQQNTCDEMRDATRRGCEGLAASAPDFCFTKYR